MSLKNVCSRPPTSFPIPTWESYKVLTHSLWIHHCIYAIPLYQPLRLLSVSPVLLLQGDELAVGLTRAHQSLCQSLRGDQSCRTQPVPFAMWFSHKTERLHLCYTLCLSVCRWIGAAEMEALKMFYLYGIVSFCCSVYGGIVKKKSQKAKCRSCMMMMMCACTWILLSHQSQGSCKSGWISLLLSGYLLIAQHSSSNDVALYQLTLYTQLSRISCYLLSLMQWVPTLSSCPTRQCMSSFPFFNFGFWCCTSIYLSSCGSNINLPAKTDFLKIYLFSTLFSCKLNNAETLWDLKETKQVAQSEFQIFFLQFFRKKLSP